MNNKKLIYLAQPYGGKPENLEKAKQLILELNTIEDSVFISPIISFGFMYDDVSYDEGMEFCLELLKRCDAVYFFSGWENSKGCLIEYEFAVNNGMDIYYLS